MSKFTLLIPLLFCVWSAYALVSEYSFTQSNVPYTDISTGTVLASGIQDNSLYAIAPPFDFVYNYTFVTQMAMFRDGYLSINSGTTNFNTNPISSTLTGTGLISPLGHSMRGGTYGELRWDVLGEAPYRYAVYQWKNWRSWSGSADDSLNFQVIIYETTNNIAFHYGSFTWVSTFGANCQVGLRGESNADFINRQTTSNWIATSAGTSNDATCMMSPSLYPPLGTKFIFNYPTSTTPPGAVTLAYPENGSWNFCDATLNWERGSGVTHTYDVYLDSIDGSTLVSDNQLDTRYTLLLQPGTTYYWKVVPSNSQGDGPASTVWSFKTPSETQIAESFEDTEFPPPGWAHGTSGVWTRRTTSPYMHGTAKISRQTSTSVAYQISTPRLHIVNGSTLDFWTYSSLTYATSVRLQVVWSDDRINWTQVGSNITYAARDVWYHQVVDLSSLAGNNYYIAFQTPAQTRSGPIYIDLVFGPELASSGPEEPILVTPVNGATDMSVEGFNLTWQANPNGEAPESYKVFMAQNEVDLLDSDYNWVTTDTSFNPVTEGGVTFNYEDIWFWTVQAISLNGQSSADPYSFTIEPNPLIISFPWSEDFESGVFPPDDWSVVDVDAGGISWIASTSYNHTPGGSTSAKHEYWTTSNQDGWLITPPISIPAGNHILSWWNYNVDPNYLEYNGLLVNTTNNPNSPGWVELWNQDSATSMWSQVSVNISAYAGQTVYFAYRYYGLDADTWYIDDVSVYVQNVELLSPVVTINAVNNNIVLNWNPVAGASSYHVYAASEPNASEPWMFLGSVSTPGFTITGTTTKMFFKVTADSE